MEQRTDDWFNARLGCVTASRVSVVLSKGIGRQKYIEQLVQERISSQRQERQFTNTAIQHGIDTEPLALKAYEQHKNIAVEEIAFVQHPSIKFAGASPDGLVGKDGLIEIKCPNTKNHYKTIEQHHVKPEYIKQMQWQLACTGRKWCDFVSYDPRADKGRRFHTQRIVRDEELISNLENAAKSLLAEVEDIVSRKDTKQKAGFEANENIEPFIMSKPKKDHDIEINDRFSEELTQEYDELSAIGENNSPTITEINHEELTAEEDKAKESYNRRVDQVLLEATKVLSTAPPILVSKNSVESEESFEIEIQLHKSKQEPNVNAKGFGDLFYKKFGSLIGTRFIIFFYVFLTAYIYTFLNDGTVGFFGRAFLSFVVGFSFMIIGAMILAASVYAIGIPIDYLRNIKKVSSNNERSNS